MGLGIRARTILEAIRFDDLLCLVNDVGHVNLQES